MKYTDPDGRELKSTLDFGIGNSGIYNNPFGSSNSSNGLNGWDICGMLIGAMLTRSPTAGPGSSGAMALAKEGSLFVVGSWAAVKSIGKSLSDTLSLIKGNSSKNSTNLKIEGNDYSFPKDSKEVAKKMGVTDSEFHEPSGAKDTIKKQFKSILKDLGMGTNPDIGWDQDGNLALRDVDTGKVLKTNVPIDSF